MVDAPLRRRCLVLTDGYDEWQGAGAGKRARAGLETLVNTTPVGVLVFDAKTGGVTSVNREARRIVSGLHMPDGSAEQLLDMLTFRRADGREVSLEEFPWPKP